jgi:hypothetical protein
VAKSLALEWAVDFHPASDSLLRVNPVKRHIMWCCCRLAFSKQKMEYPRLVGLFVVVDVAVCGVVIRWRE